MVDYSGLNPQLMDLIERFRKQFPDADITSGFRSPEYNASVGGAKNSQHTHGNAFDFSVKGMDPQQQQAMAEWLRNNGAKGFGYYPGSQSMHADLGSPRYWGPNYSSSSIGQTPDWFQKFASGAPTAAPGPAPQQVAQNTPAAPVQPGNLGSFLAQKMGFQLPNPNPTPGTPAQPSNLGSYVAQQMGMKMPAATAGASASPMGMFAGLLSAAGGGGQQQAQAPQGYEHRPDRKQLDDIFGLLS